MRPQNAKVARAHGLPKVHKQFDKVPPFRPIIDTTGSTHYGVGKYITKLLNPLTQNNYSLKDSFDAVERINKIPKDLLDNSNYKLVSLDVVSLFTNVPLKRTVNIILKRIYKDKLINTTISKRTLKKLILDTCQKTAFRFNNVIYEQNDGVSMGASLGPVLANIIMTECEKIIVDDLMNKGLIKFYVRYVDDTLLIVKNDEIENVLNRFNSFDKNLKFTIDHFENVTPHFLDIEISPDGLTIFRKDTHTGQYINISSFTPWRWKTAWIRSLIERAKKICSKRSFTNELNTIKKLASWNGYPKYVTNAIIKNILSKDVSNTRRQEDPHDLKSVFINIPYAGAKGEQLVKSCINRLKRCTSVSVRFITCYSVTKLSFFTNTKDKIDDLSKSFVVYHFNCPGCQSSYIGKTERTLFERTKEHCFNNDSAVRSHIDKCTGFNHFVALNNIMFDDVDARQLRINSFLNNTKIIDKSNNWNILLFKEAYYIKEKRPTLNNGAKASKELQLF